MKQKEIEIKKTDAVTIPQSITFEGPVRTSAQNILLAKTMMKENVYYLMRFESNNITFPDVETIEAKGKIKDEFEMNVTINLINGWKYILTLPKEDNNQLLKNIQAIVAKDQALEIGTFRKFKVYVTGTTYEPPLPTEESIKGLFNEFDSSLDIYQASAILLAKLIKSQPFFDGNKRSAFLIVNKLLIARAKGIITVPEIHFEKFNQLLNYYYDNEDELETLIAFVVANCIYNTPDKKLII